MECRSLLNATQCEFILCTRERGWYGEESSTKRKGKKRNAPSTDPILFKRMHDNVEFDAELHVAV